MNERAMKEAMNKPQSMASMCLFGWVDMHLFWQSRSKL